MFWILFFLAWMVYSVAGMIRKRNRIRKIVFYKDVYFIQQKIKVRDTDIMIPMN